MKSLLVFLCAAGLAGCDQRAPVGVVLVYEVDREAGSSPTNVPLEKVVTAVRSRLSRLAKVRATDSGKIEVSVYGDDPKTVELLLSQIGTLEFRIVADAQFADDEEIINLAQEDQFKDKKEVTDVDKDGTTSVVARWVPVVPYEVGAIAQRGHAVRENKKDETEVLVLLDKQNVTGEFLTSATAGSDENARPAVHFRFNNAGAKRFGRLTSNNLPDPIDEKRPTSWPSSSTASCTRRRSSAAGSTTRRRSPAASHKRKSNCWPTSSRPGLSPRRCER